jgi:hypothetical protein
MEGRKEGRKFLIQNAGGTLGRIEGGGGGHYEGGDIGRTSFMKKEWKEMEQREKIDLMRFDRSEKN